MSTSYDPNLYVLDHQNNTSTNNKRGTNILTLSWKNVLHKADDGKTIVCNLQFTTKINGSTNFEDVNVNITLRLIEEEGASNISKAQFINGEIRYYWLTLFRSMHGFLVAH